jgi:hypothetical protein
MRPVVAFFSLMAFLERASSSLIETRSSPDSLAVTLTALPSMSRPHSLHSCFLLFPFYLCVLLLPNRVSIAQELTLDQLIDRNVEALGGRAAIEAVRSIKFALHIADPDFEVDAMYYAARPGRMRIDITAGGKPVFAEGFNGSRAWQWKGKDEPVEESKTATGALRHGIELPGKLLGLHEVQGRGNGLALVGRQSVDDIDYYVLRLTFSDGASTTLYLDPKTWLITRRRDVRPLHPDMDPTPTTIETKMTDFRKVDNLVFSFASTDTDLKTGKVLEKVTVREITLNPPVPEGFFDTFAMPKP